MPTPYTNPWDESYPAGTVLAEQIDNAIRRNTIAIRERLVDILGITFPNDTVTEVSANKLVLKGAVSPKIIPGATSIIFRNSADSADNLIITDGGDVSIYRGNFYIASTAAVPRYYILQGNAGFDRGLLLRTGNLNRWLITENSTAESGANAGSDLVINRYDDAGALIGSPFSILRSTGVVTITNGLSIPSGGITVTGASGIAGDLTISATASDRQLMLYANAGQFRGYLLGTGNLKRWGLWAENTAEGGAELGSNFEIRRYNDAGVFNGKPITIGRNNGIVSMESGLIVAGTFTVSAPGTFSNTVSFTTGNWAKQQLASGAGFNSYFGEDANGLNLTTNAVWTGAVWNRDDVTKSSFAIIQHTGTNELQIKVAAAAANPITWLTPISITAAGAITITAATFSGLITGNSGILITAGSIELRTDPVIGTAAGTDRYVIIRAAAGNVRGLAFRSADVNRWTITADNAAEGGANAGSDFVLTRYSDAGAVLDTPIKITRSSGAIVITSAGNITLTFSGNLNVGGVIEQTIGWVNSAVGYRIGGAAASGNYLRGNGTNFVSSAIQAADLPVAVGCRVAKTSAQTIATGAGSRTAVTWDSESHDASGLHDNVTNNSRITVNKTGLWFFHARILWNNGAPNAGMRYVFLRVNGTTEIAYTEIAPVASNTRIVQQVSAILSLSNTDYVEVLVAHTQGSNLSVLDAGEITLASTFEATLL